MPPASPKGQLPFIDDEGEVVADSTFIRAHVERKYGFDFDAGLDQQSRAQAWAFERMIEHHIYWALVGARWVEPENFAKGPAHFFDGAPDDRREKLREDAQFRVAENYLLSGLGRHAPDDDVELALRSIFALSVQLGGTFETAPLRDAADKFARQPAPHVAPAIVRATLRERLFQFTEDHPVLATEGPDDGQRGLPGAKLIPGADVRKTNWDTIPRMENSDRQAFVEGQLALSTQLCFDRAGS